jgi:hypothetical protein
MRPFPRVEPVYLSTFVKNFLHISGVERSDFSIIEHTHNRTVDPDPAIRGAMLTINFIYGLYAEIHSLSALKAEHVDSVASFVQSSLDARSGADWETRRKKAPLHRSPADSIPVGCLSRESGEAFLLEALEQSRALDGSSALQQAEFAWLLPFRFTFSAPYFTRNFEIGIMIFLLLRMHWGLPFHTYGWTREEVWKTRNMYSKYWLHHGLWVNPDFPPPMGSREEKLIGTSL